MTLRVLSVAEEEFADAYAWYEAQSFESAQQFVDEVERAFERIERFPESAMIVIHDARRVILGHFPFAVWYQIENDEAVVYAICHQHREPFYWLDRLD